MPVTGGQQTAFFQDGGVGHGAFVATFNTAGFVELEDFSPEFPSKIIAQGNQNSVVFRSFRTQVALLKFQSTIPETIQPLFCLVIISPRLITMAVAVGG